MNHSLNGWLRFIDECIRGGNAKTARAELLKLDLAHLPRELAATVAALARRAALSEMAVQLLHPRLRPPSGNGQATHAEKAEYAAALTYLGGSDEALGLLADIDPAANPQVLLYQSFALFAQWKYKPAIPLLTKYLEAKGVDSYQKLVGQLNLAAALAYERIYSRADTLLEELLEQTSGLRFNYLRSSALAIAAENKIRQDDLITAQKLIFESRAMNGNAANLQNLLTRKWRCILELKRTGLSPANRAELGEIRSAARQISNWETLRDCDLMEARFSGSTSLADRVYFGTPFAAYRERVLLEFGRNYSAPSHYLWSSQKPSPGPCPLLDLESGEISAEGKPTTFAPFTKLAPDSPAHRLLTILISDFYAPFRLAKLSFLFRPENFFHPTQSEKWVQEGVQALSTWLVQSRLPAAVRAEGGFYRLAVKGAFMIRLPHPESKATSLRRHAS